MPTFNENAHIWKDLSDIDYFTQFIKAWLAFNAWMRNAYSGIRTERELMNCVKEQSNPVLNKIRSFLENPNDDGKSFRNHIADLHTRLEHTHLISRKNGIERRTTFAKMLNRNMTNEDSFEYRTSKYVLKRHTAGSEKGKIETKILVRSHGTLVFELQQDEYDLDNLEANLSFQRLTEERKRKVRVAYKTIAPFKEISWLAVRDEDFIQIGPYQFKDDINGLSGAIIEILYDMRCLLFHGEVVPKKDCNLVYEPAYRIVKVFLEAV